MNDLVLKTVSRIIIPFIQVYGIFIILNGHLSPGGAFPGGVIVASSLILYSICFSASKLKDKIPHSFSQKVESWSVIMFVFLGLIGIAKGFNFLTNQKALLLTGKTGTIISGGLIPVLSILIGIKVASTILTLFISMINQEQQK